MRHRKQIFLFLVAVLIPSLTLVFFTQKIVSQEKELSLKRLSDEHKRLAREIGRDLLLRLERLKAEVAQNEATLAGHPDEYAPARPELVMVGRIDAGRLYLPWEKPPSAADTPPRRPAGPDFAGMIRDGEKAEFEQKNLARAADLYRQAMAAPNEAEKANARLLLGRVLAKAGQTAEAHKHFEILLATSVRLKDEDGIPFYLYAADRMVSFPLYGERIAARMEASLKEKPWMSPPEASLLASLLERMAVQPEIGEKAKLLTTRLRQILGAYQAKAERLLALRNSFGRYLFRPGPAETDLPADSAWEVEENGEWLLGLGPPLGRGRLLFVVDIRALNELLLDDKDFRQAFPDEITLALREESGGDALGPSLRGLYLAPPVSQPQTSSWGAGPPRSFYILMMGAVVVFAGLGGYLLWRDVRRELDLAEVRSQFAASVSHELKTPLTAIRMFAETARLGRLKDEGARDEYLDTIINESERLSRLLNNVLDMSKIEQGKKLYHPRLQALAPILKTAARTMEYPLLQQGFSLRIDIEDGLPEVLVDADALEQALLNLLGNAIKYSGSAREIGLKLFRKDPWAVIQVSDRGIGIAPGDRQRIFEKFYRVPSRENAHVPGTGLGLALVSHFIQHHGGRVDVDSVPGRGSTFSLSLPLEAEA